MQVGQRLLQFLDLSFDLPDLLDKLVLPEPLAHGFGKGANLAAGGILFSGIGDEKLQLDEAEAESLTLDDEFEPYSIFGGEIT